MLIRFSMPGHGIVIQISNGINCKAQKTNGATLLSPHWILGKEMYNQSYALSLSNTLSSRHERLNSVVVTPVTFLNCAARWETLL